MFLLDKTNNNEPICQVYYDQLPFNMNLLDLILGKVISINQFFAGGIHGLDTSLVSGQLCLKVLVFLHLALEVGGVKVALIGSGLQFLVNPDFGLIAVTFEHLVLV